MYGKMNKEKKLGSGIAIGIVFGTVIGVLTDNIGLWLSVGIAIGAGVGTSLMQQGSKKDGSDESNKNC